MENQEIVKTVIETLKDYVQIDSVEITEKYLADSTLRYREVYVWESGENIVPDLVGSFEVDNIYDEIAIKTLAIAILKNHVNQQN